MTEYVAGACKMPDSQLGDWINKMALAGLDAMTGVALDMFDTSGDATLTEQANFMAVARLAAIVARVATRYDAGAIERFNIIYMRYLNDEFGIHESGTA